MSDLYDFPQGYRGLVLNRHRTAAGALDTAYEKDTIRVNVFDFSKLQQRDQREARHLLTGGDLGDASLAFRYISLGGIVKAPTGAKLSDRIAQILQTFDVEECQAAFPSTDGLSAFTFTDVTNLDTGRGTASVDPTTGDARFYVPEQFLARPASYPVIVGRRSGGDSATFAVELVCEDPRRYIVTPESVVLNAANGFSATCPNWDANMGKAVAPVITIVSTSTGSTLTIALGGKSLILDLTTEPAGTFTVDCATGIIKKGATHRADLRTSDVDSYPSVPRGGGTATATNTASITSVTLAYSQARA